MGRSENRPIKKFLVENHKSVNELYLSSDLIGKAKINAASYVSRHCDLELLMNGGFYPLKGFLPEEDYNCVLEDMRLKDGSLWPIPITLDVSKNFSKNLKLGEQISLRNYCR